MNTPYDVVIIGGGPAGLTAAMYAARRDLSVLLVTQSLGGQAAMTHIIENYPGFGRITGPLLMEKFYKQALKSGAFFEFDSVQYLKKTKRGFVVSTGKHEHSARAIIIASGLSPRKLDVVGEDRLYGKGVSYCVACDGDVFAKKNVAIVGGGSSAIQGAVMMSKIAKHVHVIHRRDSFKAEPKVLRELRKKKNVIFHIPFRVTKITGKKSVEKISIHEIEGNTKTELSVNALFIHAGFISKARDYKSFVALNKRNEITVTRDCETNKKGVFACGDITDISYKQIIISSGEGAKAALQAYKYLAELDGKRPNLVDWS